MSRKKRKRLRGMFTRLNIKQKEIAGRGYTLDEGWYEM